MRVSVDAILFDNDGVLVDSTPDVERHWRMFADRHGLDAAVLLPTVHGLTSRTTIAAALPYLSADEVDAEHRAHEALETDDNRATLAVPGSYALLAALAARAPGRWAVVSSGSRPVVISRLVAAGHPTPAVVVAADDVTRGKPDPQPYLLAAARLGVPPGRCLVIEDAPAGLASGRAAGCLVLGLATTHPAAEVAALADMTVPDLRAVSLESAGPTGVTLLVDG